MMTPREMGERKQRSHFHTATCLFFLISEDFSLLAADAHLFEAAASHLAQFDCPPTHSFSISQSNLDQSTSYTFTSHTDALFQKRNATSC